MVEKLVTWFTVEPIASVLTIMAVIALFGSTLDANYNFFPASWFNHLLKAYVAVIFFMGFIVILRSILTQANTFFVLTRAYQIDTNLANLGSLAGNPFTQMELGVNQTPDEQNQNEIPSQSPSQPSNNGADTVLQDVPQNSIVSFAGDVKLHLIQSSPKYNPDASYTVDTAFVYEVRNNSDFTTQATFLFPLPANHELFQNIQVKMDDQDLSSSIHFDDYQLTWTTRMMPHQQRRVFIAYSSRGIDFFYYRIPVPHEFDHFRLDLSVDHLPLSGLSYSVSELTPTEVKSIPDGNGSLLSWKFDHAIPLNPLGITLPLAQQPGAQIEQILTHSPESVTLLAAMLVLTLVLWGAPISSKHGILMVAIYSLQFLLLAVLGNFSISFWGSWIISTVLTLCLSYVVLRKFSATGLQVSLYILVTFFVVFYPLSSLFTSSVQANTFYMFLQAGLILYLIIIALVTNERYVKIQMATTDKPS